MHLHSILHRIALKIFLEPAAIRLDRARTNQRGPLGSDTFPRQQREVSDVRPAIDEMIARFQDSLDDARGIQLVQAERHAAIGIGLQIQIDSEIIRRAEGAAPRFARPESAHESRQPISPPLGRRHPAVSSQQPLENGRQAAVFPPRPVLWERVGVRVLSLGLSLTGKLGPHPSPLPEYRARGQEENSSFIRWRISTTKALIANGQRTLMNHPHLVRSNHDRSEDHHICSQRISSSQINDRRAQGS